MPLTRSSTTRSVAPGTPTASPAVARCSRRSSPSSWSAWCGSRQQPELGLLPPSAFAAAERTGGIRAIGSTVFEEGCRQAAAWDAEFDRPLLVAVNVSAQDLAAADFIPHVEHTLTMHDLGRSHMSVEITESALVDIDRARPKLHRLRDLGISVAIDDFGTGYSSLSYLRRLPADVLKIDRQFLVDIEYLPARKLLAGIVSRGRPWACAPSSRGSRPRST